MSTPDENDMKVSDQKIAYLTERKMTGSWTAVGVAIVKIRQRHYITGRIYLTATELCSGSLETSSRCPDISNAWIIKEEIL